MVDEQLEGFPELFGLGLEAEVLQQSPALLNFDVPKGMVKARWGKTYSAKYWRYLRVYLESLLP